MEPKSPVILIEFQEGDFAIRLEFLLTQIRLESLRISHLHHRHLSMRRRTTTLKNNNKEFAGIAAALEQEISLKLFLLEKWKKAIISELHTYISTSFPVHCKLIYMVYRK